MKKATFRFLVQFPCVIAFFTATTIPTQAHDFCTDPYAALCDQNPDRGNAGLNQVQNKLGQKTIQILKGSLSELGYSQTVLENGFDQFLASLEPSQKVRLIDTLYQKSMDAFLSLYEQNNLYKIAPAQERLIQNFSKTIDRLFPKKSETIRNLIFQSRLNSIEFIGPFSVVLRNAFDPNKNHFFKQAFIEGCGVFGHTQNAFAFTDPYTLKRHIMVCPGWLLSATQAGASYLTNFSYLAFVVSHEMGHHFDAKEESGLFKDYLSEIESNFSSRLNSPAPRTATDLLKFYSSTEIVALHAGEITADWWAAEAMATYFSDTDRVMPFQPKIETLRQGFGALCDSGDEGIHPDGRFRAEVILGRNPNLRESLGCRR